MIVVDASVAVKWLLAEKNALPARELLTRADKLIAPALIRIEVTSAITRRVRVQQLEASEAGVLYQVWTGLLARGVIVLTSNEDVLDDAVKLALQIQHPLQDCIYLALAMATNSELVTADMKFAQRAAGSYARVTLLG